MKPEKKCPKCKGPIDWKIHHNEWGAPTASGWCKKCNYFFKGREAPEVAKGKRLERNGEIDGVPIKDIYCMDKRISSLPCDVQIGILRERQKDLFK